MTEAEAPLFNIQKIYVKGLSVEIPHAPQIFLERDAPGIEVQLQSAGNSLDNGLFEVVLTVTVTAKLTERTVFLVEAGQAGIFELRNIPAADVEPILAIACPNILFPYVRETISDAINRAGFSPVLLSPVNFEALYQQRISAQQGAAQQNGQSGAESPIIAP